MYIHMCGKIDESNNLTMDLNNLKLKNNEIEQFLRDVREHFKASLETSEYENSSNIFHVTEAQTTAELLQRCEFLLQKFENNHQSSEEHRKQAIQSSEMFINGTSSLENSNELETPYLDMTANYPKKKSASHEYISNGCEKTYRCSLSLADICDNKSIDDETSSSSNYQAINKRLKDPLALYAHELFNNEEDSEIYDTCLVSQYSLNVLEAATSVNDCPFMNLPASNLAGVKSSKYGPLQRIEKRLFFDQCKKCFCGIVNDWLLCYAEPEARSPNFFLYLKAPAIQIEHCGEGKRRDICFQITTGDLYNEKIVFQASNEIDAKEWIHAIEAVKSDLKKHRRLPTPPIMKKITFVSQTDHISNPSSTPTQSLNQIDRIYEEPSLIYDLGQHNELQTQNDQLIQNLEKDNKDINLEFYDIPKTPPRPVEKTERDSCDMKKIETIQNDLNNSNPAAETTEFLSPACVKEECASLQYSQKIRQSIAELADKIDIQTKVKDLQSKLSVQLLCPVTTAQDELHRKALRKTYSEGANESESMALTTSPNTAKDQKKQKSLNNNITSNKNNNEKQKNISCEKPTKTWFLTRFQKTTSSGRAQQLLPNFAKCRQSEKENLLNQNPESSASEQIETSSISENKSKISMIINRLEASGGQKTMFSLDAMGSLGHSFCEKTESNAYEPMMAVSSTANKLLKKI